MTVQELIDELNKIEDKSKEVYFEDGSEQIVIESIEEETEKVILF